MKRRVITILNWPTSEHWQLLTTRGVSVVIRSISIQQIWTKGRKESPQQALISLHTRYTDHKTLDQISQIMEGWSPDGIVPRSFGSTGIIFSFQPGERGEGFCEEAIRKLVIILEKFGIKKSDLKPPEVSQETLVLISIPNAYKPNHKYWCEYGRYLAMKEGLAPF